jgi:hypothetical protein
VAAALARWTWWSGSARRSATWAPTGWEPLPAQAPGAGVPALIALGVTEGVLAPGRSIADLRTT